MASTNSTPANLENQEGRNEYFQIISYQIPIISLIYATIQLFSVSPTSWKRFITEVRNMVPKAKSKPSNTILQTYKPV